MLSHRQRGATLVELQVVGLLCLLPLLLGLVQLALLLGASQVLHYATFQAARAGAVAGGDMTTMRRALATGLLPLHVDASQPPTPSIDVADLSEAALRAGTQVLAFARLTVLSPDRAVFDDFATPGPQGPVLRNDSLALRAVTPGAHSGLTLQQASVLRIRVDWCAPLVVPLVDRLLVGLLRTLDPDLHSQRCYAALRLPLSAGAAINLQSDLRPGSD